MPTYLNTSTETKFIDKVAIAPNSICKIHWFLDLIEAPFMVKISDLPEISFNNTFFPLFLNISAPTNISKSYTARSRVILSATEISDVPDGSTIDTVIFSNDSDIQENFVPVGGIKMTKLHQHDQFGVLRSYWMPDPAYLRNSFEDSADYFHYKFGAVAVTNISHPDTVFNLLAKLL
jgi:hypothetical protein